MRSPMIRQILEYCPGLRNDGRTRLTGCLDAEDGRFAEGVYLFEGGGGAHVAAALEDLEGVGEVELFEEP